MSEKMEKIEKLGSVIDSQIYALPDFSSASNKEIPYFLNDFSHFFFHHLLEEIEEHFLPFLSNINNLENEINQWLGGFNSNWKEYTTPDLKIDQETPNSWLFHFFCFLGEEFLLEELKAQKEEMSVVFSPWDLLMAQSSFGKYLIEKLNLSKQQKLSITIKSRDKTTNYLLNEEELVAIFAILQHFDIKDIEINYLNFKIAPEHLLDNYLYDKVTDIEHDYYFNSHQRYIGFEDSELFLQGISLLIAWLPENLDVWNKLQGNFYGKDEKNNFSQLDLTL